MTLQEAAEEKLLLYPREMESIEINGIKINLWVDDYKRENEEGEYEYDEALLQVSCVGYIEERKFGGQVVLSKDFISNVNESILNTYLECELALHIAELQNEIT